MTCWSQVSDNQVDSSLVSGFREVGGGGARRFEAPGLTSTPPVLIWLPNKKDVYLGFY